MARCEYNSEWCIPNHDGFPVACNVGGGRGTTELAPVSFRQHDTRALLLEIWRTACMVAVKVRNEDNFNLCRIEPQFAHACSDNLLGIFRCVECVDQHEAV